MRVITCDELRQIAHDAEGRADISASVLVQRAGYAVAQFALLTSNSDQSARFAAMAATAQMD